MHLPFLRNKGDIDLWVVLKERDQEGFHEANERWQGKAIVIDDLFS